jgi:lysine N6-hydroxylase
VTSKGQISVEKDIVGIGAGPANLSLAALLSSGRERGLTSLTSIFLEKDERVLWHSGQLFPGTLMQTEFYRDLVTPVDPTSRFSFLNYLKVNDRLDQFFCSEYICPTRREFEDYFNWVGAQLPDVIFGTKVISVDYDPEANLFVTVADGGATSLRYLSNHIVFGCGQMPDPAIAKDERNRVIHVSSLLTFIFPEPLKRILVVGGGQSAAECVNYLLDRFANDQVEITWVTHQTSFRALDKGNFSREAFSASYGQVFAELPVSLREKILQDESGVAFGITPEIAKALYQRLYALKYLSRQRSSPSVRMHPHVDVLEIRDAPCGARVTARTLETETSSADYDCVILSTGFEDESVFDSPMVGPELKSRVNGGSDRDGYAVKWDGPQDRMIFVQSQNTKTHGLGDANFVTAPARNASILNAISGEKIYEISKSDRLVAS